MHPTTGRPARSRTQSYGDAADTCKLTRGGWSTPRDQREQQVCRCDHRSATSQRQPGRDDCQLTARTRRYPSEPGAMSDAFPGRRTGQHPSVYRDIADLRHFAYLLAMQKVVGSNPSAASERESFGERNLRRTIALAGCAGIAVRCRKRCRTSPSRAGRTVALLHGMRPRDQSPQGRPGSVVPARELALSRVRRMSDGLVDVVIGMSAGLRDDFVLPRPRARLPRRAELGEPAR